MIYKRTHPILILEGIKRLGFVFLLVLLRGFLAALKGGLSAWLDGAWVDVGIALVIVTIATAHWWQKRYRFDGKTIATKEGLILFIDSKISVEKISSVTCEQPLFYRFFGATRVRIDTLAGTKHRADMTLVLHDKTAREIADLAPNEEAKTLTPSFSRIILLSAFISDSLAGAGLVAVSVTRVGAVLGEELEQRIATTIDNLLHHVPSGLPPIAKTIAVLVLFGWTMGFLINLIRHAFFTTIRDSTTLTIKGGALTKRATKLKLENMSFIEIKQGLFSKLFGIGTVFVHATGVGKSKADVKTLAPTDRLSSIQNSLKTLLPEYTPAKISLRPDKRAFLGFIADPLWLFLPLAFLTVAVLVFTKAPTKLVLSLSAFVSIPAVWWLLVRIVDLFGSGIGILEDTVTLRYSSFLKFSTAIIKRKDIVSVKLRQSLFQRISKRCDVLVYTKGETAFRHRVRNLDVEKARKLLRI